MSPKEQSQQEVEQLLDELHAYLAQTESLIGEGRVDGLPELNAVADALSLRLAKIDPAKAGLYAGEFASASGRLVKLEGHMQLMKAELAEAVKALGERRKAARAYLSTPES